MYSKRINFEQSAAIIDKDKIIKDLDKDLKHYWEFEPNTDQPSNADWLAEEVRCTINNDGINDRFDYEFEKPSDVYRIIALGDSFTYGHFVNTEENWTEILEDLLNAEPELLCGAKKIEVINLGMPGHDRKKEFFNEVQSMAFLGQDCSISMVDFLVLNQCTHGCPWGSYEKDRSNVNFADWICRLDHFHDGT